MALFHVILGRRDAPIKGEGLYLRFSEMRDYEEWATLRDQSRAFLTPWEPLWPPDDLTRASFRYRVRRHMEEAEFVAVGDRVATEVVIPIAGGELRGFTVFLMSAVKPA